MSDSDPSAADPFEQILDEFVEAFRQGKHPSVEEFARRYPAHADAIRDMLPALALMEKAKATEDTPSEAEKAAASRMAARWVASPQSRGRPGGTANTVDPGRRARRARG
jgi:hypothetical protein